MLAIVDPADEAKIDNDRAKNLIDLYKVCSEEVRHSATTFWSYAVAILGFEGVAVGWALKERTLWSEIAVCAVAVISICLSIMLTRQAHDRSCFLTRLRSIEARLCKDHYGKIFDPFPQDFFHQFKSGCLAWIILLWSGCLLFVVAVDVAVKVLCRC